MMAPTRGTSKQRKHRPLSAATSAPSHNSALIDWLSDDLVLQIMSTISMLPTLSLLDKRCHAVCVPRLAAISVLARSPFALHGVQIMCRAQNWDAWLWRRAMREIGERTVTNVGERAIGLSNKNLLDAGVSTLSAALHAGALAGCTTLTLANNRIGDAGVAALAGAICAGALPQLKVLELGQNAIGDAGLTALSRAGGALGRLERLFLHSNRIRAAGLAALCQAATADRGYMKALEELHLDYCPLERDATQALAKAIDEGAFVSLRKVFVSGRDAQGCPVVSKDLDAALGARARCAARAGAVAVR